MEMNTGNWISIIIAIVGVASAWGALTTKIGNLKEKVGELSAKLAEAQASRERSGERIGKLESELGLLRYAINELKNARARKPTLIPERKGTPPEGS